MALINQPSILPSVFAAEGDKNVIPSNNDGLAGLASILKGFPPITQLPLSQGGMPPQRQDFNGIFNLFSQFLVFAQNGGVFQYNASLDYQPPAIIADGSSKKIYKCIKANGPTTSAGVQGLTNSTYWLPLSPDDVLTASDKNVANGVAGLDGSTKILSSLYDFATQSEAEAGVNNTKPVTSLRVKQAIDKIAIPVGTIFFLPYLADGNVKLNGATVQRSSYTRLAQLAESKNLWTNNPSAEPWKFGRGNGSSTMVLPDYRNRFIQGGDNTSVREAGLPNFKGTFVTDYASPTGNITSQGFKETPGIAASFQSDNSDDRVTIDLSKASPIYGRSNTVQPPAIVLIPQMKY